MTHVGNKEPMQCCGLVKRVDHGLKPDLFPSMSILLLLAVLVTENAVEMARLQTQRMNELHSYRWKYFRGQSSIFHRHETQMR